MEKENYLSRLLTEIEDITESSGHYQLLCFF